MSERLGQATCPSDWLRVVKGLALTGVHIVAFVI